MRVEQVLKLLAAPLFGSIHRHSPCAQPAVGIGAKATSNNLGNTSAHGEESIQVMVEPLLPRVADDRSRCGNRCQLRMIEFWRDNIAAHLPQEKFRG
jgi:hypothetical protein